MHPIIRHILDGNVSELNDIPPDEFQQELRSESGRDLIELAKAKGRADVLVCILRRRGAQLEREEWAAILCEYISELSDSYFCAGWLDSIEFMLWARLVSDAANPFGESGELAELTASQRADLAYLAERVDGWVTSETNNRRVPIEDWLVRYEAWRSKNGKKLANDSEPSP